MSLLSALAFLPTHLCDLLGLEWGKFANEKWCWALFETVVSIPVQITAFSPFGWRQLYHPLSLLGSKSRYALKNISLGTVGLHVDGLTSMSYTAGIKNWLTGFNLQSSVQGILLEIVWSYLTSTPCLLLATATLLFFCADHTLDHLTSTSPGSSCCHSAHQMLCLSLPSASYTHHFLRAACCRLNLYRAAPLTLVTLSSSFRRVNGCFRFLLSPWRGFPLELLGRPIHLLGNRMMFKAFPDSHWSFR